MWATVLVEETLRLRVTMSPRALGQPCPTPPHPPSPRRGQPTTTASETGRAHRLWTHSSPRQIEFFKLNFRGKARSRTDHGADIITRPALPQDNRITTATTAVAWLHTRMAPPRPITTALPL